MATEQNQVLLPASPYEAQDYTDINVKSLLQDIVNDPGNSHGILFKLRVEEMYRRMLFASGDHENTLLRPEIEVIYMICTPPVVDFEYIIEGQDANFTGICPTANSWHWDFGDGFLSVLQNPIHYYQEKGFYEVCLTVADSCGTAQFCQTIQVCDMPAAGFEYVSEGLTVTFLDTSRYADHYFWSFGDGFYSDLPEPVRTYDTAGYYQVCLNTWNDCGADTVCQMIFVDYSGLTEPENPVCSFFPNPARDLVYLSTNFSGTCNLTLHDLGGTEVMRKDVELKEDETMKLNLGQIKQGFYIVKFVSGNNQHIGKLVVMK
jgi:PKD repeat protein